MQIEQIEMPALASAQNVGYVRELSAGQNIIKQLEGVLLNKKFEENVSVSTTDRSQLRAAIDYCKRGDVLHIHSLDRVCSGGISDALKLINELQEKGVNVKFHKELISIYVGENSPYQKTVLSTLAVLAEAEGILIAERRRNGQKKALDAGVKFGRPKAKTVSYQAIMDLRASGITKITEISAHLGVHRATIYRVLSDIEATSMVEAEVVVPKGPRVEPDAAQSMSEMSDAEIEQHRKERNRRRLINKATNRWPSDTDDEFEIKRSNMRSPFIFQDAFLELLSDRFPLTAKLSLRTAFSESIDRVSSSCCVVRENTQEEFILNSIVMGINNTLETLDFFSAAVIKDITDRAWIKSYKFS